MQPIDAATSRQFLVTCEHGGNEIPSKYKSLFREATEVLQSHRGWDIGALNLARELQNALKTSLFFSTTSRLLIDLNRSLNHPDLFSSYSKVLSEEEQNVLIVNEYRPYRDQVIQHIQGIVAPVEIVHLSIHSFTPELNGSIRETDIGILSDPERPGEIQLSKVLLQELQSELFDFQIHLNRPYLGTDDGLTTSLRTLFTEERYVGIELEVNQKYLINFDRANTITKHIVQATQKLMRD